MVDLVAVILLDTLLLFPCSARFHDIVHYFIGIMEGNTLALALIGHRPAGPHPPSGTLAHCRRPCLSGWQPWGLRPQEPSRGARQEQGLARVGVAKGVAKGGHWLYLRDLRFFLVPSLL